MKIAVTGISARELYYALLAVHSSSSSLSSSAPQSSSQLSSLLFILHQYALPLASSRSHFFYPHSSFMALSSHIPSNPTKQIL